MSISSFSDNFSEFLITNNILGSMAAVTIAFSTGVFMRSIVGDIIIPWIYSLLLSKVSRFRKVFSPITHTNIDNFIKEFVTWIFVIIITFIFITYIMKSFVKYRQAKKINDEEIRAEIRKEVKQDVAAEVMHTLNIGLSTVSSMPDSN